ncbi:MAG: hypothetical protein WBM44_09745 [Waterburya sp.]
MANLHKRPLALNLIYLEAQSKVSSQVGDGTTSILILSKQMQLLKDTMK